MNIIESQTIWALDKAEVRAHLHMDARLEDITNNPRMLRAYAKLGLAPDLHAFLVRNTKTLMDDLVRYLSRTFPELYTTRDGIEKYLWVAPGSPGSAEAWRNVKGPWSSNPRFFEDMDVDALVEVFSLYEGLAWHRIRESGRSEMTMGQIAAELGKDWPRKTASRTVGSFERKRTSVVRTRGYGRKVKLPLLLSCVLWAAFDGKLSERPQGSMSPLDAIEAANLTEAEERVIHIRFLDGEPRTLDEAGHVLKVTRERVRQIQGYALDRMRRRKLVEPVREWLLAKSEDVFDRLSEDGGLTVKRAAASGTKAKAEIPGLALALEIADMRTTDLLGRVAILGAGGHWIRKI